MQDELLGNLSSDIIEYLNSMTTQRKHNAITDDINENPHKIRNLRAVLRNKRTRAWIIRQARSFAPR